ncbi:hypothetical protein WJX75_002330 [Coccomyxa subellipsoidea]|uniref:Uncharacterized protein n=1 Tax=Coccomyxa subellipsoidea TaxID=248742 RepID=A0ABR2YTT2_9CHLO
MLVAEKEVVDGNIGTSGLYFGIPDTKEKLPRKTIAAVSAFGVAIVTSLLLFGGCYRYNIYLKRELADAQHIIVQQQGRALGRLKDQVLCYTIPLHPCSPLVP